MCWHWLQENKTTEKFTYMPSIILLFLHRQQRGPSRFCKKRKLYKRFSVFFVPLSTFKTYSTYTWKSQAVSIPSSHLLITWEIFQIFYPLFHSIFFISLKRRYVWISHTNNKYLAFPQIFILTLNFSYDWISRFHPSKIL